MSATPSSLVVFRQAYFGPIDQYQAWHDGFSFVTDLACLDALAPAERAQAATELLAALRAHTADARALLGLAHLRYAEALPLLHDYLRRGAYAFYALEAIAAINPAGFYPPIVAARLRAKRNITEYQLMDLLLGLREYFALPQLGPLIPPLIFNLLTHAKYLVRYHALNALRRLYSVTPPEAPTLAQLKADQVFGLICEKGLFTRYAKAQRLLLAELPAATLAAYPLVVR